MEDTISKLPEKFVERLYQIVPQAKQKNVITSLQSERPQTIRVNTLKTDANSLKIRLERLGFMLHTVSWYHDAFIVDPGHMPLRLTETEEYTHGLFYIQSLASMIPALLLNPKFGEVILDIAAAPGSKTTQIACMMQNTGEIVANDISTERLYKLRSNLRQQGVTNTKVTKIPGQIIWKKFPEYFDRTLVDAPCSLEGRISLRDPKSYQEWSLKKIELLSKRERYLLRSAISATKVGGTIVYSTCTLSPEENEGVIDWILTKEKGEIVLEESAIPELPKDQPITSWKKSVYDKNIRNVLRIFPSEEMEGFFVAKFKKIAGSFQ